MKSSGRLAAAIEILDDFSVRRVPLKIALADWARGARYAGAKDRAWISGLCLDALRRRSSLADVMGAETGRDLALGALRFLWEVPLEELAKIAGEEPHGPGPLTQSERTALGAEGFGQTGPAYVRGDFPEWLMPNVDRAFGPQAAAAMAALARRADIDLRVNTLKTTPDKALAPLKGVGAEALPVLTTAARIPAPAPSERAPAVTIIPAFNKGWVEVQDLGSQIAAAAAGDIKGAQVLDYCAGGGGKTLALAALMENTGQLYAYDSDPHRLAPLFDRARRAGLRNLQIRSPAEGDDRADLVGKMDVVFIDAPCSGSGTWRRRPDTKWRLTPQQLAQRMAEQDQVLAEAAAFVKLGGRLVWTTCSVFIEENEDRLAAFLENHPDFYRIPALDQVPASGLLTEIGRTALEKCAEPDGALRLMPHNLTCDGFYVAVLQRGR